jgi:hypothetical protein
MEIIRRTRNHLWLKVDANEVISGVNENFDTLELIRTQVVPIGISNGLLQASLGDLSMEQDQAPGVWSWAFVDLTATASITKIDTYPYFRATQDSIVVFGSLD